MAEPRVVLIIEGDENLRRLFALALTIHGFVAREARSGIEALGLLEHEPVDAVVLEAVLPDIDGTSVREEIAAHPRGAGIPVIILTSFDGALDHLNPACILRKPATPGQVVEAVKKCLDAIGT